MTRADLILGDCLDVMAELEADSIDAIVTDPPYGLEFMGKEWDAFRLDDPGTMRHRGEHIGGQGDIVERNTTLGAAGRVAYGAGKRPSTSRCTGCGKRDQFRNEHPCTAQARWVTEPIDPYAAPPTSLAFGEWCRRWALAAYRIAKPGAHLLAFGGTRTHHRLMAGLEDAGWEIRDCLVWGYASGFPKSLDVSKAIDKRPGVRSHARFAAHLIERREAKGLSRADVSEAVVGTRTGACWNWEHHQFPRAKWWPTLRDLLDLAPQWGPIIAEAEREKVGEKASNAIAVAPGQDADRSQLTLDVTAPATPEAAEWAGWGTALKPAWEPIVLARKPLRGTVAASVLEFGTGALNIDATRIPFASPQDRERVAAMTGFGLGDWEPTEGVALEGSVDGSLRDNKPDVTANDLGRWPANIVLSDPIFDGGIEGVVGGGEAASGIAVTRNGGGRGIFSGIGDGVLPGEAVPDSGYGDSGTYSRFFLIPKAARSDREPPIRGQIVKGDGNKWNSGGIGERRRQAGIGMNRENTHPTVKPTDLMRHLVRLVTPPGGVVLDPFLGSGTTAVAAEMEGFGWVGIERDPESHATSAARLNGVQRGLWGGAADTEGEAS